MPIKVAINGFGRIGRLAFRIASKRDDIQIVAINDLVPSFNLAYLLKFDTTHGRHPGEITFEENAIIVDGKKTSSFQKETLQSYLGKTLTLIM